MRVALSTWSRFHFFDLARELHQAGVLARICTNLPRYRLRAEGLSRTLIATNPMPAALRYAAIKHRIALPDLIDRPLARWIDGAQQGFVAGRVNDCDALVALSGAGLHGGRAIRTHGGKYVCERASAHAEWQRDLITEEARRFGLPAPYFEPRFIEKELEEYAECDALVAPSQFVRRSFVERGVPAGKIVVNPYGVSLAEFGRDAVQRVDDEFRVVWVGQIGLRKGIPDLLSAFAKVRHPRKRLLMAGSVTPDLKPLLAQLPMEGVGFLGHLIRADIRRLLNSADVFCIASIEDGFAVVITQAMACGLPVVGTTNCGAPDVIDEGVEGFIVPARDPAALAERLQRLVDAPDLRRDMGQAAMRKVQTMGGWRDYGQRYLQLLSRLTGRPIPARGPVAIA